VADLERSVAQSAVETAQGSQRVIRQPSGWLVYTAAILARTEEHHSRRFASHCRNLLLLAGLILIACSSDHAASGGNDGSTGPVTAPNLRVLPWAGFKAAVTFTFDDSQPSHTKS
jgi:hypothetical protein